ncbi:MAG: MBL fold metallo-hydrolase [Solidesulfovibrio sp.]
MNNMALALEAMGKTDEALSICNKVLLSEKSNITTATIKQRLLYTKQQLLKQTTGDTPTKFMHKIQNGDIFLDNKDYEKALTFFDSFLAQNNKHKEALFKKSIALKHLGRHNKSYTELIYLYSALKENKNFEFLDKISIELASTHMACERFSEAHEILTEIIARNAKDDIYDKALLLLAELRKQESCRAEFKKTIPINITSLTKLIQSNKQRNTPILDEIKSFTLVKEKFLDDTPAACDNRSFFIILQRWNSFTPVLPNLQIRDRANPDMPVGGGYYLRHNNFGVVIDPGFDFIKNFANAGLRLQDIDAIVLTHAHNDHTAELESLLTLLYKYNDQRSNQEALFTKTIDLYMNLGSFQKFSGYLNLHSTGLGTVRCIFPEDVLILGKEKNLKITILNAYHNEIVSRKHSVGLYINIANGTPPDAICRSILLTSDTSLFPQKIKQNRYVVDTTKKEIWETYPLRDEDGNIRNRIDLLISHLGSIKESEFQKEVPEEALYLNHLGIIGTVRVIAEIKPTLAVISEFGEEFSSIREPVAELTRQCLKQIQRPDDVAITVLPADIGFEYDIIARTIFTLTDDPRAEDGGELAPCNEVRCAEAQHVRYHRLGVTENKLEEAYEKWQQARRTGIGWYLKGPEPQTAPVPSENQTDMTRQL